MTALDFLPLDPVTYFRDCKGIRRMIHAEVVKRNGTHGVTIRIKSRDGTWQDKRVLAGQVEKGHREGAKTCI